VIRTIMLCTTMLAAALVGGLCVATPAAADFCLQMSGELSGDLGFFRFQGALPKKAGEMTRIHGRVAGLSPAFGAATRAKDGTFIEIGATFFADDEQGQFDIFLDPPGFTTGAGGAEYGNYGVNNAVTVAVVDCKLEP